MRNIIVTGSSGQLGKIFVEHLAKNQEFKIYACDINIEEPVETKNISYQPLDVTFESSVKHLINSIPQIDVLINNAGIGVFTPFEERTISEFMDVINVNMKGTFLMCREVLKKMKKAGSGKIINIGSIYGVLSSDPRIYGTSGRNNSEIYSMTKAGVIMMTRYLATSYAKYNIQINAISPGGIFRNQDEEFVENYSQRTPVDRMANPEDLLPSLDFLVDETNNYFNGQNLLVDGGFSIW